MSSCLVADTSFINIQGWMINKLNLKGNDLLVYAIIYGFSQDGESRFKGSLQYLADWCQATKNGIQKNLKNLLEKGLIRKFEDVRNNVKYCEYSCTLYNSVVHPIQLSCTNKLEDNIDNNTVSKDTVQTCTETTSVTDNADLSSNDAKPKKLSLYDKCVAEIDDFCEEGEDELKSQLLAYLELRLKMKDKPLLGVNQWKGMLRKLGEMANTEEKLLQIVNASIEHGWASFYELAMTTQQFSGKSKLQVFGEDEHVTTKHYDDSLGGDIDDTTVY